MLAKRYSRTYTEPKAKLSWAGLPRLLHKGGCVTAPSRAEHIQGFQMSLVSPKKLRFNMRAHHAAFLHFLNPAASLVMILGDGKMNKLLPGKGSGGHSHE